MRLKWKEMNVSERGFGRVRLSKKNKVSVQCCSFDTDSRGQIKLDETLDQGTTLNLAPCDDYNTLFYCWKRKVGESKRVKQPPPFSLLLLCTTYDVLFPSPMGHIIYLC